MSMKVKIWNKYFEIAIHEKQIQEAIDQLALQLFLDYEHKRPIFLVVLKGAYVFAADLLRKLNFNHEVDFVRLKSYVGSKSSGKIELLSPLPSLVGRNVVIIEDIVDSGLSISYLESQLLHQQASTISCISLLYKPKSHMVGKRPQYICFEIDPEFVVGYGMDYNEYGRNLPHIYKESSPY